MPQGEIAYKPKVHFSLVSLFFGIFLLLISQTYESSANRSPTPLLRLGLNSLPHPIPQDLAKYGKSLGKCRVH